MKSIIEQIREVEIQNETVKYQMNNLKNNPRKMLTQKAGDTLSVAILRQVAIRFAEQGQADMASVVFQDIREKEKQFDKPKLKLN